MWVQWFVAVDGQCGTVLTEHPPTHVYSATADELAALLPKEGYFMPTEDLVNDE